jgi:hypothetical protein
MNVNNRERIYKAHSKNMSLVFSPVNKWKCKQLRSER